MEKKILGTKNSEYAISIMHLGNIYQSIGDYKSAEMHYLKALPVLSLLGDKNQYYLNLLNNLSLLYEKQDKYIKAEELNIKALKIRKEWLGIEHPEYLISLENLASVYFAQGKYDLAEPLLLKAVKIAEDVFGDENKFYLIALDNLAKFYAELGNSEKAELIFQKTLRIREKKLDITQPEIIASLNGLASVYYASGNYKKAEPLFEKALELTRKIFGTKHPNYIMLLKSLGSLYLEQGLLSKAESSFRTAMEITKRTMGIENSSYSNALAYLGDLYLRKGENEKSEQVCIQALLITKKIYSVEHPNYLIMLHNLVVTYYSIGNYEKMRFYLNEILPLIRKRIILQTSFQTSNELNLYLKDNLSNYFHGYFSLAIASINLDKSMNGVLLNNLLLLKNLTLRNTTQVQNKIRKTKDSTLINTLENYQSLKRQLNKNATLPKSDQPKNINDLEDSANTLEKKLVRGSQAFKEAQDFTNTRWQDVQKSLKKDEAAIEFVSFRYYNRKWTDSILYAAMVIRPNYSFPKIIPLFEQKQLDSLMKRNPSLPEENYLNNLYSKENFGLYNLIAKPIDSLLRGVTTIYAAPSGSLYNLNLAQILSDKPGGGSFNVHILGTTGELPKYSALQINNTAISSAVVFGGVNYDTASNSGISFTPPVYTPGFEQVASVTNRGGTTRWSYLPGTLTEATQIAKINTEAGVKVTLLKGDEANESTFKNLNGFSSPYILHLATHGYFFPNPVPEKPKDFNWQGEEKKLVYKWSEDPLLRSGLILAGANKAWQNSAFITDSTEDGILTSMEVANVDLSNCKLAVLSACETGLGDINGSEGVFGLQRGFKLAGVKNIIMSLWKIPDAQSAELLELFYQNCFRGLTVHESLKQAQKAMSEKYPPYYWAGFVLLE